MNNSNRQSIAEIVEKSLAKRKAKEKRFRFAGMLAVITALIMLAVLLLSIVVTGLPAFTQTAIKLDFHFEESLLPASDCVHGFSQSGQENPA